MAAVVGRIRRRSSFRALARPDGRAASRGVAVSYRCETGEPAAGRLPVVAYAIGKRHGGAVARNRLRRRLRAAVRAAAPGLPPGAYLLRAEPSVSGLGPAELVEAVARAAQGAAQDAGQDARAGRPAAADGRRTAVPA